MTVRDALRDCIFRKYANGAGRAARGEFFVFFAFYVLFFSLWSVGIAGLICYRGDIDRVVHVLGYAPFIFLPPLLAVSVRRYHDTGRTGWLALLLFVPLINLLGLALLCAPGTTGPNRYGPQPAPVRLVWS